MNTPPQEELSEAEVRKLRDEVYGPAQDPDKNWVGCRDNWMRPDSVQWLIKHAAGKATK